MLLNTRVDTLNKKYHPNLVVVEVDHNLEQQNIKIELIVCIEAGTLTKYHPYHLNF
jgi:hypothetical protein